MKNKIKSNIKKNQFKPQDYFYNNKFLNFNNKQNI